MLVGVPEETRIRRNAEGQFSQTEVLRVHSALSQIEMNFVKKMLQLVAEEMA